jgi:hypothetical protein
MDELFLGIPLHAHTWYLLCPARKKKVGHVYSSIERVTPRLSSYVIISLLLNPSRKLQI